MIDRANHLSVQPRQTLLTRSHLQCLCRGGRRAHRRRTRPHAADRFICKPGPPTRSPHPPLGYAPIRFDYSGRHSLPNEHELRADPQNLDTENATLSFACTNCDSPAIAIPGELCRTALVKCGGCGRLLGTWSQMQQDVVAQVLIREGVDALARSADPLPVSLAHGKAHFGLSSSPRDAMRRVNLKRSGPCPT